MANQHRQQKTFTAKASCSCVHEQQHKVYCSWTHKPSSHNSKLGSQIPNPSQTSLLHIVFKYNSSLPHTGPCRNIIDGLFVHTVLFGSSTPTYYRTPQAPARAGTPLSTGHTGKGAIPAQRNRIIMQFL